MEKEVLKQNTSTERNDYIPTGVQKEFSVSCESSEKQKSRVIYPVKKEFIRRIFDGTKAFCKKEISSIILYESRGSGKVVGECQVVGKICSEPSKMWMLCKEYAGIEEEDFFAYFKGCSKACAYILGDVNIFLSPKSLQDYGVKSAPQNYVYVE